jgi:hypothetical protein
VCEKERERERQAMEVCGHPSLLIAQHALLVPLVGTNSVGTLTEHDNCK